jgi:hypothetical protein
MCGGYSDLDGLWLSTGGGGLGASWRLIGKGAGFSQLGEVVRTRRLNKKTEVTNLI